MAPKKILVIEDDAGRFRAIRRVLTGRGHSVVGVRHGKGCVDRVLREGPDLIVVGIAASGRPAFDEAKRLRDEPRTSAIPVIAITTATVYDDPESLSDICADRLGDSSVENDLFVRSVEDILQVKGPGRESDLADPTGEAPAGVGDETGIIVVADDEARNRRRVASILEPLGYTVRQVASGEEALDAVNERQIDLLLLDFAMPGTDSLEITRRIRSDPSIRAIPIILLTAFADRERKLEGIEAGCDDFIDKPFDRDELVIRIRSLIRLSRFRMRAEERERLDTVLGESGEGIVFLDGAWRITEINNAGRRLLALPPEDCAGTSLLDHLAGRRTLSADLSALTDPGGETVRFRIEQGETESSAPLILSAYAKKFRSADGKLREVILTIKDISASAGEERMKDEFLSTMSHKFKTPLSVVMANCEYLTSGYYGDLAEEQSEAVREIGTGATQLLDLFDKLLAFIAPGSLDGGTPQPRELGALLGGYVSDVKKKRDIGEVRIDLEIDRDVKKEIIDYPSFTIALDNIVENAIKFNRRPGARVKISAGRDGNGATAVSVTDNGPGIPSEHTEKIFQRFYQVEKFHTGKVEGVGLGLPLARRII